MAGSDNTAAPASAERGPNRTPRMMVVSKEMSAAKKLGTISRTHTPSPRGTQMKASNPNVCDGVRFWVKSRFWKVRARASALDTAAATPSLMSKVLRMSLGSITSLLYPQRGRLYARTATGDGGNRLGIDARF